MKTLVKFYFIIVAFAIVFLVQPTFAATFTNPVRGAESADPWVILKNGTYYYMYTTGGSVDIRKSDKLETVFNAPGTTVWRPNGGEIKRDIWAPELHFLNGKWYVYVTGNSSSSSMAMNVFVLEANTSDPLGAYTYKGILLNNSIDANVFQKDGKLYILWSQFDAEGQCIYIAPMNSPTSVGTPRVKISKPEKDWEKRGEGQVRTVNEGPQALIKNNVVNIVYSASACDTQYYCLGLLTNRDGNLLNASSWVKYPEPIFKSDPTNGIYGPGHNSFTTSLDGKEDWLIYHAKSGSGLTNSDRSTRMQPFTWNSDNTPKFGTPIKAGVAINVPGSGNIEVPGDGSDISSGSGSEVGSGDGNLSNNQEVKDKKKEKKKKKKKKKKSKKNNVQSNTSTTETGSGAGSDGSESGSGAGTGSGSGNGGSGSGSGGHADHSTPPGQGGSGNAGSGGHTLMHDTQPSQGGSNNIAYNVGGDCTNPYSKGFAGDGDFIYVNPDTGFIDVLNSSSSLHQDHDTSKFGYTPNAFALDCIAKTLNAELDIHDFLRATKNIEGGYNYLQSQAQQIAGAYVTMHTYLKLRLMPPGAFKGEEPEAAQVYGKLKNFGINGNGSEIRQILKDNGGSPFNLSDDQLAVLWGVNEHINLHAVLNPAGPVGMVVHMTSLNWPQFRHGENNYNDFDKTYDKGTAGGYNDTGRWPQWGWFEEAKHFVKRIETANYSPQIYIFSSEESPNNAGDFNISSYQVRGSGGFQVSHQNHTSAQGGGQIATSASAAAQAPAAPAPSTGSSTYKQKDPLSATPTTIPRETTTKILNQ